MSKFQRAFFAYASAPPDLARTIETATSNADLIGPSVQVTGWPQMDVFGSFIPEEVHANIDTADVLICDVTVPNANVYYEVGFAIGRGKSVAPVLNRSFAGAADAIQSDGIFDVVGYRTYENSEQLLKLLGDLPDRKLLELYGRNYNSAQPLYFLTALRKTDFIIGLAAAIKSSKVHFRSFDPSELSRFSSVQAIADVTSSAGVIIPFLGSHIEGAHRHNLRGAFLAGLTHGVGRHALLLQLGESHTSPADFRNDIVEIRAESDLAKVVLEFATASLVAAQSIRAPRHVVGASALQQLYLGATAAENEFRTLEDYFVKTAEFLKTERGEVSVVAGRKGSGKTAIFFMVRDSFRRQKNAIVVDLKPESHQLTLFREQIINVLDIGAFDHTLAAFWHFLILTEILIAVKAELEFQAHRNPDRFADALEIARVLDTLQASEAGDFTARLNRLGAYLAAEIKARAAKGRGSSLTPDELTNLVFKGGIAAARSVLIKYTRPQQHVLFLFDNIDKGWQTNGVDQTDIRIVRLLVESLDKVRRDLSAAGRDFIHTVFLRNDVYELLIGATPDRGKTPMIRIDWADRSKLRQVIYRRLQATSPTQSNATFEALWERYFTSIIAGAPAFEYLVDRCLMRPRFLINLLDNAVANAINRGHNQVTEEDCVDAVRQHALYLMNDFGFEIRDVSGVTEHILTYLVGLSQLVTKDEITSRLTDRGITVGEAARLFDLFLWYGLIGIVSTTGTVRYIYDFEYMSSRLTAEIALQTEPLFNINPALYVALR